MGNSSSVDGNVRDSVTSLTGHDKQVIRDTWLGFKKQLRTGSVTIFVVLFMRHPQYQKLFTIFADEPIGDLPKNPRMLAHALTFAYAITAIVDSLEEPETTKEIVRKVAIAHANRGPDMKTAFEHMGTAVVDTLTEKLGTAMTPTAIAAWKQLFTFIVALSEKTFEETRRRNDQGHQPSSSASKAPSSSAEVSKPTSPDSQQPPAAKT
ncbi:extracellular globin-E1-like [Rhipicephalus sanguineus]|uniref:extracellular globin-E1-like n=1 Tax=Rhipicephalus sanguineus TaxID=34632 RepID=UPI001895D0FF|nr:extracellular globin-E1-like [Rhipicephalus sanguineus]